MNYLSKLLEDVNAFETYFDKNYSELKTLILSFNNNGFKVSPLGLSQTFIRLVTKLLGKKIILTEKEINNIFEEFADIIYLLKADIQLIDQTITKINQTMDTTPETKYKLINYLSSVEKIAIRISKVRIFGTPIKTKHIKACSKLMQDATANLKIKNKKNIQIEKVYQETMNTFNTKIIDNLHSMLFDKDEGVLKKINNARINLEIYNDAKEKIEDKGDILPLTITKINKIQDNINIRNWKINLQINQILEYRFYMYITVLAKDLEIFCLDTVGSEYEGGPVTFSGLDFTGKHFDGALLQNSRTKHTSGAELCQFVKEYIRANIKPENSVFQKNIHANAKLNGVFYENISYTVNNTTYKNTLKIDDIRSETFTNSNKDFLYALKRIYHITHMTPTKDNVGTPIILPKAASR